jgi:hypothetical protein
MILSRICCSRSKVLIAEPPAAILQDFSQLAILIAPSTFDLEPGPVLGVDDTLVLAMIVGDSTM